MVVTDGMKAEFSPDAYGTAPLPSLPLLAAQYAALGDTLRHFATVRPVSAEAEFQASVAVERLLAEQRDTLETVANREVFTRGDMIAKLEIWRAEVIDCKEENIGSADRLVLSVLEALKRQF